MWQNRLPSTQVTNAIVALILVPAVHFQHQQQLLLLPVPVQAPVPAQQPPAQQQPAQVPVPARQVQKQLSLSHLNQRH